MRKDILSKLGLLNTFIIKHTNNPLCFRGRAGSGDSRRSREGTLRRQRKEQEGGRMAGPTSSRISNIFKESALGRFFHRVTMSVDMSPFYVIF